MNKDTTLLFIIRLHQGANLSCFDSIVNLRFMIHNYDTQSSGDINIPLIVSTRWTFSVLGGLEVGIINGILISPED